MEDSATRQSRTSAASRAYAFIVTALAVVAIGLYFCRTPVQSVVAQLGVLVSADLADQSALIHVAEEAKTKTLSDASLLLVAEKTTSGTEDPIGVDQLREQIQIEITPRSTGHHADVSIVTTSPTTGGALKLAKQIGEVFQQEIDQHADDQASRIGDAAIQLDQSARSTLQESQQNLDAFVAKYGDALAGRQPQVNVAAPAIEENLQWQELRQQISDQEAELSILLTQRTEEHPMVINVKAKIASLQAQLTQVPRFADPAPSVPAAQLPPVNVEKLKSEHERLKQAVTQARLSLQAVGGKHQIAADGHRFYTSISAVVDQSPHVAGMIGGNFPLIRVGMLLAVATLLGGFAALCIPTVEQEAILVSSKEIAAAAGVSIVAELPLPGGPAVPRKRTATRMLARFAIVASEYSLVALVGLILVALLVDPEFTRTFTHEPFTALYNAQNQLWKFAQ
ncbi:hypothetical protein LOC68_00060 [Blastopirellula sp. JC732]|uniref:Uncharacterized protein n=1 Tax=Blastopirellula sediminis TaxID=2894196 RepID=A0A9X1SE53_9BACT|nr:hypothetical protein [Blastopirellula sediminis]MCC9604268.1 hypothetical protein [Blastopirellula sediminis]MCC9626788.1 hypothetical protein [Blastopirellula sediminis]